MKIALCKQRILPAVRKQDGFVFLPPEARFDLIVEVDIKSDFFLIDIVNCNGINYIRTEERYGDLPLFREAVSEYVAFNPLSNPDEHPDIKAARKAGFFEDLK